MCVCVTSQSQAHSHLQIMISHTSLPHMPLGLWEESKASWENRNSKPKEVPGLEPITLQLWGRSASRCTLLILDWMKMFPIRIALIFNFLDWCEFFPLIWTHIKWERWLWRAVNSHHVQDTRDHLCVLSCWSWYTVVVKSWTQSVAILR